MFGALFLFYALQAIQRQHRRISIRALANTYAFSLFYLRLGQCLAKQAYEPLRVILMLAPSSHQDKGQCRKCYF